MKLLTKFVSKWLKKTDLDDDALSVALEEVSDGKYEASLGGNLYKKRVPLKGKGKSGGTRIIVCFNDGENIFAIYAFKKNEKSNISKDQLKDLKKFADYFLNLSEKEINEAIENKLLFEA